MWLGSFVVVLGSFVLAKKFAAELFLETIVDQGSISQDRTFVRSFISLAKQVIFEISPMMSLNRAAEKSVLNELEYRLKVLRLCLSSLGTWWAALMGIFLLSFNGLYILGFCSLAFISFFRDTFFKKYFILLFTIGAFLVGGNLMLKNASILVGSLNESEIVFFLADGRLLSVLMLLLVSAVASVFIQIEFFFLILAFSLLPVHILSMNGALGLIAGEQIGSIFLFWFKARNTNERRDYALYTQFAIVYLIGTLVGLLVSGEMKSFYYLGYSGEISALLDVSLKLMFLFSILWLVRFFLLMSWGHFFIRFKGLRLKT
jgi:hypothetical protein